jgi:hypothetical protein
VTAERKDVGVTASPSATPVGTAARHAYCPLCGQARVGIRANSVREVEAALCPGRCLIAWQALEALREQEAASARVSARRRLEYESGQAHPRALSELLLGRWREGDWTVPPEQVLRQMRSRRAARGNGATNGL